MSGDVLFTVVAILMAVPAVVIGILLCSVAVGLVRLNEDPYDDNY